MIRFALVHPGDRAESFRRVGKRLKNAAITAVVEADEAAARRVGDLFDGSVWATSTKDLHTHHDASFDAWAAMTAHGLIVAPHDNRPLDLDPERWSDRPRGTGGSPVLADGWLWGCRGRFLPSVRAVKESIDAGKLGAPGLVRIHDWRPAPADCLAAIVSQLDVACWLIGAAPTIVHCQALAGDSGYRQVHLGFPGDAMAVIDCWTPMPSPHGYYSLSVIGAAGAAHADDQHNAQLLFADGGPRALVTGQGDFEMLAALEEYIAAQSAARTPVCGAGEWRRARALFQAVEESVKTAQAVPFQEPPP